MAASASGQSPLHGYDSDTSAMQTNGADIASADQDPDRLSQEAMSDAQYPEVKQATALGQICRYSFSAGLNVRADLLAIAEQARHPSGAERRMARLYATPVASIKKRGMPRDLSR